MLDKSIPYKDIIMSIDIKSQNSLKDYTLPKGYRTELYKPGYENFWAYIETSVLEFDSEESALIYFAKEFLPYKDKLANQMVFVFDDKNTPAATATAWQNSENKPKLHWVATHPKHQRMGLAKAAITEAVSISRGMYPNDEIILHTQTWSHSAIRLYHKLGFRILKAYSDGSHKNQYYEAMKILKQVYDKEFFSELEKRAL